MTINVSQIVCSVALASLLTSSLGLHYYTVAETILNIVNRSVAKTIVGEPLCYDEAWLRTSLETTRNTGLHCLKLQKYPAVIRPLVNPFLESRRRLDHSFKAAQGLLSKAIEDREKGSKNITILQWLIDSRSGAKSDIPFLTNQTLFVAIASTRSTATSIVNALFDLVAYQQCQKPLRDEIGNALEKSGGWDLSAIQEMKRLDSFVKESQRLNHHLLCK